LRAAAWFDDYIISMNNKSMKSFVLYEGIKGWANAGPEYIALMNSQEH
jgi:arsenical-resistance protein 2